MPPPGRYFLRTLGARSWAKSSQFTKIVLQFDKNFDQVHFEILVFLVFLAGCWAMRLASLLGWLLGHQDPWLPGCLAGFLAGSLCGSDENTQLKA